MADDVPFIYHTVEYDGRNIENARRNSELDKILHDAKTKLRNEFIDAVLEGMTSHE